jgi:LmbE family N-acetylglucosaminyl deacetylase
LLEIARAVEHLVAMYQPAIVLTHHAGDVNIDHRRIHEAVVTACRPQPGNPVRTVLTFEVASSTEWQFPGSAPVFAPSWFVDISDTLAVQQAALAAYAEELRPWPHPRSPEALRDRARWRGASIGVEAAEAFMLCRHIVAR